MLTTTQAAALLGIQPRSVVQLIRRNIIKAERFGRDFAIEPAEVERYQQERKPAYRPRKTLPLV